MSGLSLFSAPAAEPITLAEAKLFAKVDVADDDTLITDLAFGARKLCEERWSWAYITQTWDYFLDAFPIASGGIDLPICLPRTPVQSVTSVTYTKSDGTPVVISSSDYQVDVANKGLARIYPVIGKTWPADLLRPMNGVAVRFVAGYGAAASSVPEQMRLAMKQLVAFWYQNRDAVGSIPDEIDALLSGSPSAFAYA